MMTATSPSIPTVCFLSPESSDDFLYAMCS